MGRKGQKRKRGQFTCKKCGHKANGPFKLGQHYQKHPSHASAKSINQQAVRHRKSPVQRTQIDMQQRTMWLESFLSGRGRVPPAVIFEAAHKENIGTVGVLRKAADLSKQITRFATGKAAKWEYTGPNPIELAHTPKGWRPLGTAADYKQKLERQLTQMEDVLEPEPPKRAYRKRAVTFNFCPNCGHNLQTLGG